MGLDRLLCSIRIILGKPRYLVKDKVTEWSTAVEKLSRQSEEQW